MGGGSAGHQRLQAGLCWKGLWESEVLIFQDLVSSAGGGSTTPSSFIHLSIHKSALLRITCQATFLLIVVWEGPLSFHMRMKKLWLQASGCGSPPLPLIR